MFYRKIESTKQSENADIPLKNALYIENIGAIQSSIFQTLSLT